MLLAGSALAVGAVACGSDAQQASDPPAADAQPQQQDRAREGHAPAPSAAELGVVAKELGVSTARLRAAIEATRPGPGRRPGADPLSALAEELGVSSAKLREAMRPVKPRAPPAGATPA